MKDLYQKCKLLGSRISKSSDRYLDSVYIEEDGRICVSFSTRERGDSSHWSVYLSPEDLEDPIEDVIKRHHQKESNAKIELERIFKEREIKEKAKQEEFELQTYLRLKLKYEQDLNK